MNEQNPLEEKIKKALEPAFSPDYELQQKLILKAEEYAMNKKSKRMMCSVAVAVLALFISVSAYAAIKILTAAEFAKTIMDTEVLQAFEGEGAVEINESVESGDYRITLLGIAGGNRLSQLENGLDQKKNYAVVAIEYLKGEIPSVSSENFDDYGDFLVTPLIHGEIPWQVNIFSMSGGAAYNVIDGVLYKLIECDDYEIFADRGVYIAVNSGTFYSTDAFHFDEVTGEISLNEDFDGVNALFRLPLDPAKGDADKAKEYLDSIFKESSVGSDDDQAGNADIDTESDNIEIEITMAE